MDYTRPMFDANEARRLSSFIKLHEARRQHHYLYTRFPGVLTKIENSIRVASSTGKDTVYVVVSKAIGYYIIGKIIEYLKLLEYTVSYNKESEELIISWRI